MNENVITTIADPERQAAVARIARNKLEGYIEGGRNKWRVPFFSCRGYTSQSEMYSAAQRLSKYYTAGCRPRVFHLGDHDPSGIDMTRDIINRLNLLSRKQLESCDLVRLALNMEQVKQYNPPPNPAKMTDSRAVDYIGKFGEDSWELDALEPKVVYDLLQTNILMLINQDAWAEGVKLEDSHKETLRDIAKTYWIKFEDES